MKLCDDWLDHHDDVRKVVWPIPCTNEARWMAHDPETNFTWAVCENHKLELDDPELIIQEFPQGLTDEEAQAWALP